MQALANFQGSDGKLVAPRHVSILQQGTRSNRVFCLRIDNGPCGRILLSLTQVRAIAHFVANHHYRAFTWPDDSDNPQRVIAAIKKDMVAVGDSYPREDWIAKEFAGADLAKIFRYMDYDDPLPFTSSIFSRSFVRSLRQQINAKAGHFQSPRTEIVDQSYFNSDFHANFVARVSENAMICDGLPARYYWSLHAGQRSAYVTNIEFALPDFEDIEHIRWSIDAHTVFCTTAILRTLMKQNLRR